VRPLIAFYDKINKFELSRVVNAEYLKSWARLFDDLLDFSPPFSDLFGLLLWSRKDWLALIKFLCPLGLRRFTEGVKNKIACLFCKSVVLFRDPLALDMRGWWDLGLYGGPPIRATILTFVEL
jgi:hypothetical protein